MKFEHNVKFNGKYYPTGADVPVGKQNKTEEPKKVVKKKVSKK